MTPPQIRAARGLLNWTVQELAEKAGLDRNTVAQIESGRYASDAETMAAILRVLEAAGIEFTNGRWGCDPKGEDSKMLIRSITAGT